MFLLLSLLLIIVIYPVLDHGERSALDSGSADVRAGPSGDGPLLAEKGLGVADGSADGGHNPFRGGEHVFPIPILVGTKWALLAAFFGLTVYGLFPYLKNARSVTNAHLYTAVSIYLLLGMQWFALYSRH